MNIVIIGASGKIGCKLSKYLINNHNLLVHYYKNDIFDFNVDKISCNLSNDYKTFIHKIKYFNPEVLINCFATYTENDFYNFNEIELKNDLLSNSIIPLFIYREFAKLKSSKSIINFLDSKALTRDVNHYTYALSKQLLEQITNDCAYYLAPVRVNGINLGLNESDPFTSPENLPLKKKVSFEDIFNTVDYLINNENITGNIIHLDSGRHLRKFESRKQKAEQD